MRGDLGLGTASGVGNGAIINDGKYPANGHGIMMADTKSPKYDSLKVFAGPALQASHNKGIHHHHLLKT